MAGIKTINIRHVGTAPDRFVFELIDTDDKIALAMDMGELVLRMIHECTGQAIEKIDQFRKQQREG